MNNYGYTYTIYPIVWLKPKQKPDREKHKIVNELILQIEGSVEIEDLLSYPEEIARLRRSGFANTDLAVVSRDPKGRENLIIADRVN